MAKTQRKNRRERGAGFTLIELLVVVLIIGILAALAIPQYVRVVERGRVANLVNYVQSIKGSEERYFLKFGAYTATVANLDITPPGLTADFAGTGPVLGGAGWTVQFSRINGGAIFYTVYTVTWNLAAVPNFVCTGGAQAASCQRDLMPP